MRFTSLCEPDPLERVPGPSLAGNRPQTDKLRLVTLITSLNSIPLLSSGVATQPASRAQSRAVPLYDDGGTVPPVPPFAQLTFVDGWHCSLPASGPGTPGTRVDHTNGFCRGSLEGLHRYSSKGLHRGSLKGPMTYRICGFLGRVASLTAGIGLSRGSTRVP